MKTKVTISIIAGGLGPLIAGVLIYEYTHLRDSQVTSAPAVASDNTADTGSDGERSFPAGSVTDQETPGEAIRDSSTSRVVRDAVKVEIVDEHPNKSDLASLVRRAFEAPGGKPGFPLNCIKSEVVGNPEILEKDARNGTISVKVVTRIQPEAYDAFAKRLMKTLDGIAKRKGEFSLVGKSWAKDVKYTSYSQASGIAIGDDWRVEGRRFFLKVFGVSNMHMSGQQRKTAFALAVNTTRTRSFERTEWKYYVMDRSVLPVLAACAVDVGGLKLTLLDRKGKTITVSRALLAGGRHESANMGLSSNSVAISPLAFYPWGLSSFRYKFHGLQQNDYKILAAREGLQTHLAFLGPMFFATDVSEYFISIEHDFRIRLSLEELAAVASTKLEVYYEGSVPPTMNRIEAAIKRGHR